MRWAEVWKRRAAQLYMVGTWMVFSYVFYYANSYPAKRGEEEEEPPPPQGSSISEDGLKETIAYSTPGRMFSVVSTTVYKPNVFFPMSRLNSHAQSFLDDSGSKGK